ncbi:MAG: hypothetical protein JNM72_21775 [Deltaproteobacteria bacterium]|nr:hypothetical protein [Deltaproteobacteria bacterium]
MSAAGSEGGPLGPLGPLLPRFWRLLGSADLDEVSVEQVDLALARALSQLALAARVHVAWWAPEAGGGWALFGLDDAQGAPAPPPPGPAPARAEALALAGPPGAGVEARWPTPTGGLLLRVEGLQPDPFDPVDRRQDDLLAALRADLGARQAVVQTVGTVRARSAVAAKNRLLSGVADAELELQFLLFHDRRPLRPWLQRAAGFTAGHLRGLRAAGPAGAAEALRLGERLSRRLMHRLVEGGWRPAALGQADEEGGLIEAILADLQAVGGPPAASAAPAATPAALGEEIAPRHAVALWVIAGHRAATPPPALDGGGPPGARGAELRLFCAAEAAARAQSGVAPLPAPARVALHEALRADLPSVLAARAARPLRPSRRARSTDAIGAVRAWLRLWLVAELLRHGALVGLPEVLQAKADRALTGLLRALLRQKVFYGADPAQVDGEVRAAGQVLVRLHAREVLRLKWAPIEDLLDQLAEGRPGRGAADGDQHVDHVIDHYLLAQLLLSAGAPTVGAPGAPSLAARLVGARGAPGLRAQAEGLAATMALASLFHDCGLAWFPQQDPQRGPLHGAHGEPAGPPRPRRQEDPLLAGARARADEKRREGGRALVIEAREALRAAGLLEGEPGLNAWIAAQEQAGAPDHALSSALVLLQAVPAAQRAEPTGPWAAAVRAVLLHGARGEPVRAARDPAAALLLLCDETFDWDPAQGPRASRAAELWVEGLQVTVEDGLLRVTLPPSPAGGPASLQLGLRLGEPRPDQGPPLLHWLAAAHNLGRIDPGESGPALSVLLVGPRPPGLQAAERGSYGLLLDLIREERLPETLRCLIEEHLHALPEETLRPGEEGVRLGPLPAHALGDDPRLTLHALSAAAARGPRG